MAWPQRIAKYFGAVVTAIAGITAIVAAIYGIYENRSLFGLQSSEISIRPMASNRDYMLFLVENEGNGSASIGRVTGQFGSTGAERRAKSAPLRLDVVEYRDGKSLIAPGTSQQLRIHFADRERLENTIRQLSGVGEVHSTQCIFGFEIISYDGTREVQEIAFDCREYAAEYLGMRNQSTVIF